VHPEEVEILERIRNGDMEAFETVFRAYYQSLCLFSLRYLKRIDLAEEIVQDIFVTIWDKRSSLQFETSLKSYLYRSVHNNSLKYLQHQKVVEKHAQHLMDRKEQYYYEPLNNLQVAEVTKLLENAFASMPQKTREIFSLSRDEGLKYAEIAEKLEISVKTVEAHMGSALKILRENLKEYLSIVIIIFLQIFSSSDIG
jgi:RNA polymerase sigma-70 factor (ECF subfamily)